MRAIQTVVRTFAGKPCCLISAHDPDKGYIKFARQRPWTDKRLSPDLVVITDSESVDDRDLLYLEEHIQLSVRHYFDLRSSGLLDIAPDMTRFDASNAMELDGIKEKGRLFRFDQGISNEHIAALATAFYVRQSVAVDEIFDFHDAMSAAISSGEAVTI